MVELRVGKEEGVPAGGRNEDRFLEESLEVGGGCP